ncbi:MAG: LysM peptidoglycan-binding domain-containing M23 family metallopeptidase [Anaerolineae bacterium]
MRRVLFLLLLAFVPALVNVSTATGQERLLVHMVQPGDTWTALAWRYNLGPVELAQASRRMNRQRQPAAGTTLLLPDKGEERFGRIERTYGGLLELSLRYGLSPWALAVSNGVKHPFRPLLYRPVFIPGGSAPPRDLPIGFHTLELSQLPAHPGEGVAIRATTSPSLTVSVTLDDIPLATLSQNGHLVGVAGTGAFFSSGAPELTVIPAGGPLWPQPWRFDDRDWDFEQITLTGSAAAIDSASIAAEYERLSALWAQVETGPLWEGAFQFPITSYLEISSHYGARRSYNGGPYRSYHEGVDFSAYGGTAVTAAAAGRVVLAEQLYVRGNAVIIDHGVGVYTGYYHLSNLLVSQGQFVNGGDPIGAVGSTGLSTGNHLHWDLLVGGVWVDAAAWRAEGTACWILEGLGLVCDS